MHDYLYCQLNNAIVIVILITGNQMILQSLHTHTLHLLLARSSGTN